MNWKVEEILRVIDGSVACLIDGERKTYSSAKEAMDQIKGKYVISSVSAQGDTIVIALEEDKTVPNDMKDDWVKDHVAQFGKEPNPFDRM